MPRGEENQEVPQEEVRDRSEEIQEQDLEAQRGQEVVAEPEAVIERERPIEESEAIEAAVIEAVEAADLQDQTAGIEDVKEQVPTSEQVAVTPIPIPSPPKPGEEVVELDGKGADLGSKDVDPQPPPERVVVDKELVAGEDRVPETEDREAPEIMDEVSGKHYMPVEDGELILDETSFKFDSQAGIDEESLNQSAFKFFTPTPDQEFRDGSAEEGAAKEAVPERESGEIAEPETVLDETSGKHYTPVEDGEVILDETSFKSDSQAEVDEETLNQSAFKFFTPTPDQEFRDAPAEEGAIREAVSEGETGEILEPDAFKPIPAQEGTEVVEHTDHWSEPIPEQAEEGEILSQGLTEEAEDLQEEEGGSILIGEEGEEVELGDQTQGPGESLAGQTGEGQEVEEYWEPPEMYEYTAPDGTKILVDGDGNPIKCPPQHLVKDPEGVGLQGWYEVDGTPKAFEIPPWPGYLTQKYYYYHDGYYGKYVDADGNPVPLDQQGHPPKEVLEYINGLGENAKQYDPIKNTILIYTTPDGTKTFVHSDGTPLKCPPNMVGDPEDGYGYKGAEGQLVKVQDYQPPTEGIYVYTAPDGSKTIVDVNGDSLTSPPAVYGNPENGFFTSDGEGGKIQVSEYYPPAQEVYIYHAQDGSVSFVDQDGNPLKFPPMVQGDGEGGYYTKVDPNKVTQKELTPEEQTGIAGLTADGQDSELVKIPVKEFIPSLDDVYVYIAQDGTKTIVDATGNPVNCPPNYFADEEGSFFAKDSEGNKVNLAKYDPPLTDIYVYTAADGSKTVVDQYGNPVKSPPPIWNDPKEEGQVVTTGPDGKPYQLQAYKPISSHWD